MVSLELSVQSDQPFLVALGSVNDIWVTDGVLNLTYSTSQLCGGGSSDASTPPYSGYARFVHPAGRQLIVDTMLVYRNQP